MIRNIILLICIIVLSYIVLGYVSSYMGWDGFEKWKYRVHSSTIAESRERHVFIKKLHFDLDSFSESLKDFQPFIEKGFRYGRSTSEQTVIMNNTDFPYQLSFNPRPTEQIGILIRSDQLQKFDSTNSAWGFLKKPELPDTILLVVQGENVKSGTIKVW